MKLLENRAAQDLLALILDQIPSPASNGTTFFRAAAGGCESSEPCFGSRHRTIILHSFTTS